MANSLDLTTLLPTQYRDKTIDSLLKNLFNKQLSKVDTVPVYGYIGDQLKLLPGEVQITESNLERQLNQLTPFIYAEHASEKMQFSWYDLVQKMVTLGVDYQSIQTWFNSKSYNFVPPIDLDKFCNFQEYFWIGKWFLKAPNYDYISLGIPTPSTYSIPSFNRYGNTTFDPEYYVIAKGVITNGVPVSPIPTLPQHSWSDWSYTNMWVHRDDIIKYIGASGNLVNLSTVIQATRPIIEYSCYLGLNTAKDFSGAPTDIGVSALQSKTNKNQLPLFNLYNYDGSHTNTTSAIFYYTEGQEYPIDSVIGRRLARSTNNDFVFGHSLVNQQSKSLNFYKLYDPVQGSKLLTIWRQGLNEFPKYSKYDTTGSIINQDMFANFANYYWTGCDSPINTTYNPTSLPEYYVIEKSGTSDWSVYNHWTIASSIPRADLVKYVQATRPIIEFNINLESQLIVSKTSKGQLPKFHNFIFDKLSGLYQPADTYAQLISSSDPVNNDAYLTGHLFARVSDLSLDIQTLINKNPNILSNNCFIYNNDNYIQGLFNGAFASTDYTGVVQGYKAIDIFTGVGNGELTINQIDPTSYPELITFTFNGIGFDVIGSVTGTASSLTIGTPYTIHGCTLSIVDGNLLFLVGDKFTIEISSAVFYQCNRYIDINGSYRTLTTPIDIINEVQNTTVIQSIPSRNDGVWEIPPQIEWNILNETRNTVNEGDLYYHLTSIISAQPNLVGYANGPNNWKDLTTKNVGLGGTIKQFDGDSALLISNLLQVGISPLSLIDFARESYQSLPTSINQFVVNEIPKLLATGKFIPPISGDAIDPIVVSMFKTYFSAQNPVVLASSSVVDDIISSPFYDSTSSIFNLVATLPYLGLISKVQPQKYLDLELNLPMLRHHDGHSTQLETNPIDVSKKITQQSYLRSPGQETPGIFSGFDYPAKPYAGQFWFKTTTNQLFIFNAVSDDGSKPIGAINGSFAYDRATNNIWEYNGIDWIFIGNQIVNAALPWVEIKIDLIMQNLELAIETELYNNCPALTQRLNVTTFNADSHYNNLMAAELEQFGVKYGAVDVYATTFDPNNAFTWNYSGLIAPGAQAAHSTWQDVYQDVYGTSRPDLQPWVMTHFGTEAAFIAQMISLSLLPVGTISFNPTMWSSVGSHVLSNLLTGIPATISVDLTNGTLLPPYAFPFAQSLLTNIPSTLQDSFPFGTNGPVERFWRKTLNFLYSQQKSYFKIDPLTYVRETWGIKHQQIGEYTLASQLGRKESPSDFILHGDSLSELAQPGWILTNQNSIPLTPLNYNFTCVSRIDGIFKLTIDNNAPTFVSLNSSSNGATIINSLSYSDSYVTISINPSIRGFYHGDSFNISIDVNGIITTSISPQIYFRAEGFNQLFVQYGRIYGTDTTISVNTSLLNNWTVKMGYRFNSMINTDNLVVGAKDLIVDVSAYNVYLKENKFYNSSWLNALRVQVVQVGGTRIVNDVNVPMIGSNGTPGEDWIFRVDNYNKNRTSLSWYNYDVTKDKNLFVAMNGVNTAFQWTRHITTTSVQTHNSPFLITGIQNFVNFIFGYSDKLHSDGWRFNDPTEQNSDTANGYQKLVEQFIDYMFTGVTAGASFGFNPFYNNVWYSTPHGAVSDVFNVVGLENETVCSILAQNNKQIAKTDIRIFRQDDLTKLVFDSPVYTLHLLTSEYEHIILFENYSTNNTLLFDTFLGQKTNRIFFDGKKQSNFNGRINFGGHFLVGDTMKKNIESSVSEILGLYDTNDTEVDRNILDRSRSLLGYQKKSYFKNRMSTDSTQFRFWQGLISSKGTNYSIDAFTNSASYNNVKLQEYWAYKIAEYGNFKQIVKTEITVEPDDCSGEFANFMFLEADDIVVDKKLANQYGMFPYDHGGYSSSILESLTSIGVGTNNSRWVSYSDINTLSYFEAVEIGRMVLPAIGINQYDTTSFDDISYDNDALTAVGDCFVIRDLNGKPVIADCFEILHSSSTSNSQVFHEYGDLIANSSPSKYTSPKFSRINGSTIKILDLGGVVAPLGNLSVGSSYTITSIGSTNFTLFGANSNVVGTVFNATGNGYIDIGAGAFIIGETYKIKFAGTTDYVAAGFIGTPTVGMTFIATNTGSGTGIVSWCGTGVVITTPITGLLEVVAYGPASKLYSPHLLYDYVENTLVKNDIIWWDPARNIHHPQAVASIDFNEALDPAFYTDSKDNSSKLKTWGSTQVGKVWWNTDNLYWKPYSDNNSTIFNQLSGWGSLSDTSAINVYEWVKSSTPPSSAKTGISMNGEPAISKSVARTRTWWQRPVAWKYSNNPSMSARAFLAYQPSDIQIINGVAVLRTGSFDDLKIVQGTKISGAIYNNISVKNESSLNSIFGLATVNSQSHLVVGSANGFSDGPTFQNVNSNYTNFQVLVDSNILFRTNYLGHYILSVDQTHTYLTLTHVISSVSQQLLLLDVPTIGNQITYSFSSLGVTITMNFNSYDTIGVINAGSYITGTEYTILSHGTTDFTLLGAPDNNHGTKFIATSMGSGSGLVSSLNSRILDVSAVLTSSLNQIWLRSAVDVVVPIPFSSNNVLHQIMQSNQAQSSLGWIAWNDPTTNPINGIAPPLNQYEPIAGDWIQVGSYLHDLSNDISLRISDPWTWFDGNDYTPYKSSWSQWSALAPLRVEARYLVKPTNDITSFNNVFKFPGFNFNDLNNRASVYLNEKLITNWSISISGTYGIVVDPSVLKQGDNIRVVVSAYKPTKADLLFDPVVSDNNPFLTTQYKQDYPYVTETLRDINDNKTINNYYYWVKNKTVPGKIEKLSTTEITNLLISHDGIYAIPQRLKLANQIDLRPNRYSVLSVRNLGQKIKGTNRYKLRINKDPSLRDRDENITLKPIHTEWKLLYKGQTDLLPIDLWNTLVDTLVGSNKLNQPVPFDSLKLYDQNHGTSLSYGVNSGQIMTSIKSAIDTVKYTILNTQVDKYVNGILTPDYIAYTGFDISQLDNYFSTPINIRKFMTDLLRFAKPIQINEIFFAVLEDMAAHNLEIDMLFKTSFISL